MENQTLFESGEITRIRTRVRDYEMQEFILGVHQGGGLLVAIDRQQQNRVKLIPITAVLEIEVEYANEQAKVTSDSTKAL